MPTKQLSVMVKDLRAEAGHALSVAQGVKREMAALKPTLPEGVDMVMPGDSARIEVSLDRPIALEAGSRFAIREGGRTVGAGTITEIIE